MDGTDRPWGFARACIRFNGRNAKFINNTFSDSNWTRLLFLDWTNVKSNVENRKTQIKGNQIHISPTSTFVNIQGDIPRNGILMTNNMMDIGCGIIIANGSVTGLTYTGNTWTGPFPNKADHPGVSLYNPYTNFAPIYFASKNSQFNTISGNTFSSIDEDNNRRPTNFIRIGSDVHFSGSTITGNTFVRCTEEPIFFDGTLADGGAANVPIIGNTTNRPDMCNSTFIGNGTNATDVLMADPF